MMMPESKGQKIRVAVIDLYNGEPNQGMRCIREILEVASGRHHGVEIGYDVFETRCRAEAPSLDYDAYISTGGPGSPFEGEGMEWEARYFDWLDGVWRYNQANGHRRKHVFFICHSFQMMCRFFRLGRVTRRRSESFGIFPVHKTDAGVREPLFQALAEPFYGADFRKWQVVEPDRERLRELGAKVLALEKIRPHVQLDRALMAVRVSAELIGVQFHPEADAEGMLLHFSQPHRRVHIVENYGEAKYYDIIYRMKDANFLDRTHRNLLPAFLKDVVEARLRPGSGAGATMR